IKSIIYDHNKYIKIIMLNKSIINTKTKISIILSRNFLKIYLLQIFIDLIAYVEKLRLLILFINNLLKDLPFLLILNLFSYNSFELYIKGLVSIHLLNLYIFSLFLYESGSNSIVLVSNTTDLSL